MKKSIIFSLTAIALIAFAFTSCKKDSEVVTEITGLAIKPATVLMSPGDSRRLTAVTEPSNAVVTITWTSSNPDVVEVSSNGTITAVDLGEATITAKSGDYSATCAVTVKNELEILGFTGAFVHDFDTTYSNKIDTFKHSSGVTYLLKQVLCNVMVFTEGFYFNNDGDLTGAEKGGILEFQAPFSWAPAWLNGGSGTILVLGDWAISGDTIKFPDGTDNVGRPGAIEDEEGYTNYINEYVYDRYVLEDYTKAGQDLKNAAAKITGATLTMYEYHTEEEGYPGNGYFGSNIPDLIFGEGWFELGNNYKASKHMCSVESYKLQAQELKWDSDTTTLEFYQYGAHFQETEIEEQDTIVLLDHNVHFGNSYTYEYNLPAQSIRKANKEPRMIEIPVLTDQQRARIKEQLDRAKSFIK